MLSRAMAVGVGEQKPTYEVGYHIVPAVADDAVGAEVARARAAIESSGGSVVSEEWPKRIELAYPIALGESGARTRHAAAHFGWIRFEAEPAAATAVREKLDATETLLRSIVVGLPESALRPRFQKRRIRPVLKQEGAPAEQPAAPSAAATEEFVREIEKLVAE